MMTEKTTLTKDLRKYCTANSIKIENTIFETPQLNGVAKRKNRTISKLVK